MPEKILIVDDDVDTLRLVGLMLQKQGYDVQAASSGKQALTLVKEELPDLILLDVMMPDMDGYEVARQLREEQRTADIPIIMFTAKSQVDDKVMGFEAGADDYLTKPTQPKELFAHLKAVLTRTGKARQRVSEAPPQERGQLIAMIAPKGGLGVSTLALNLGIAVHEAHNKSVIVAEFRPGQATIGLELGILNTDSTNALLHRKASDVSASDVAGELQDHPTGIRLWLTSHNPSDARHAQATENFAVIARHLSGQAQVVVLDLGASLTSTNQKVIPLCQQIVMVVEPVPHTLIQAKLMLNAFTDLGIGSGRITTVLVNRARSGVQLSWSQVQEQLGRNIAVIFTPAPELAYQAALNNAPLYLHQPDSLTAQQFTKLAEHIGRLFKE